MGIKITLKAENTSYEGRFALHFRRERRDVANLLVDFGGFVVDVIETDLAGQLFF